MRRKGNTEVERISEEIMPTKFSTSLKMLIYTFKKFNKLYAGKIQINLH